MPENRTVRSSETAAAGVFPAKVDILDRLRDGSRKAAEIRADRADAADEIENLRGEIARLQGVMEEMWRSARRVMREGTSNGG